MLIQLAQRQKAYGFILTDAETVQFANHREDFCGDVRDFTQWHCSSLGRGLQTETYPCNWTCLRVIRLGCKNTQVLSELQLFVPPPADRVPQLHTVCVLAAETDGLP